MSAVTDGRATPSAVTDPTVRDWIRAELARDALRALAEGLASVGVTVAVVKGVHLAFAVEDAPWRRALSDADAVVVQGSHRAALRWARQSGAWRVRRDDWSTAMLVNERGHSVDLHRRPLPAFFGRLDAEALARRARPMPEVFGPHVLVPDPLDAAALAIAHFVKDKCGAFAPVRVDADLDALSRRAQLGPSALAERLAEHGLRRVGLVAFASLARREPRWTEWGDALAPSRAERAWASFVSARLARSGPSTRAGAFLLSRTIGDSPRAIAACATLGTLSRVPWIALERASRIVPPLRWI